MLALEDKLRVSSKHSVVLWKDIFYKSKNWHRKIPGTNKQQQQKPHNFLKKRNLFYASLIIKHMKSSLVTDDLALVAYTCDSSI